MIITLKQAGHVINLAVHSSNFAAELFTVLNSNSDVTVVMNDERAKQSQVVAKEIPSYTPNLYTLEFWGQQKDSFQWGKNYYGAQFPHELIRVIKAIRTLTGMGLTETKHNVEVDKFFNFPIYGVSEEEMIKQVPVQNKVYLEERLFSK